MPKKPVAPPVAVNTQEIVDAIQSAQTTLVQIKTIAITPANMETIGAILVEVKRRYKVLEEQLKTFTEPHRKAEKAVRDWFRPGLKALEEAEAHLKAGISEANRQQWLANQQATQQAQVALAQGNALAAAQAATAITHTAPPAGVGMREAWGFRVVQPELVPRELCEPSDALIRAAIAAGHRQIPGVLIEPTTVVTVRTS